MDKLITFAVPCYNSAAYMEHCVAGGPRTPPWGNSSPA